MSGDKKLRVLEVNKLYYPHIGGIETVIKDISEGINDKCDLTVLVCQKKGQSVSELINGVHVNRSSSLGIMFSMPVSFPFIFDFKRMAKNADIVHIHMPFPLADLAAILSGYKGKIVASWHSDVVKQKKLMTFYKPIMNKFLKMTDCIITATEGHIKGSAYLAPYASKCKVIPYGLDIEKYVDRDDFIPVLTNRLNSKQNLKVLFVGRLIYYKGVEVLVNAFKQIYGCELFIVGEGALEGELKTLSLSLGIEDKVHFLGVLSDAELKSAYEDCDIFVLPSVASSEAFGIVQMEAMVYGKPVINTSLPTGVPYVSLDGKTGFTVPPNDVNALSSAIQKLADDDELRGKFGENAYNRVREEYDLNKVNNKVWELFNELCPQEKDDKKESE